MVGHQAQSGLHTGTMTRLLARQGCCHNDHLQRGGDGGIHVAVLGRRGVHDLNRELAALRAEEEQEGNKAHMSYHTLPSGCLSFWVCENRSKVTRNWSLSLQGHPGFCSSLAAAGPLLLQQSAPAHLDVSRLCSAKVAREGGGVQGGTHHHLRHMHGWPSAQAPRHRLDAACKRSCGQSQTGVIST